ncbi:hypothetical protein ACLOJK_026653 [Asimina triloba]
MNCIGYLLELGSEWGPPCCDHAHGWICVVHHPILGGPCPARSWPDDAGLSKKVLSDRLGFGHALLMGKEMPDDASLLPLGDGDGRTNDREMGCCCRRTQSFSCHQSVVWILLVVVGEGSVRLTWGRRSTLQLDLLVTCPKIWLRTTNPSKENTCRT